jgi:hypothetical protein
MMFEIVNLTLLFHSDIYQKKIITTIYPEVEEKYSILVNEIIKITSNKKHTVYTILQRPDLAGSLVQSIYISINRHINFYTDSLINFKDIIIENIEYSKLTKDEQYNIVNKLNIIKNEIINIPDDLIDQFTCELIKDPVKIPDIDYFFDRTSILTQIQHNKQNPYTREILTYEMFIEYNNKPEIVEEVNEFKKKLNIFLKE